MRAKIPTPRITLSSGQAREMMYVAQDSRCESPAVNRLVRKAGIKTEEQGSAVSAALRQISACRIFGVLQTLHATPCLRPSLFTAGPSNLKLVIPFIQIDTKICSFHLYDACGAIVRSVLLRGMVNIAHDAPLASTHPIKAM
jgi:hypothetical protein